MNNVQTILIEYCVPSHFWCEALSTVVTNGLPSSTENKKFPYFHLFKHASDYFDLRIFECVCLNHLQQQHERNELTT